MSKTKQTTVHISKDTPPERKCNITPIYMARYIESYFPDDKAWFKKLREDNSNDDKAKQSYYGFNVSKVREAFIEKYFSGYYKKAEPKSRRDELDDLMKGW